MSKKRNNIYNPEECLKIFVFTYEEFVKFEEFFKSKDIKEHDNQYVSLQTRLMLIRKYETKTESIYLRNVLEAVHMLFPNKIRTSSKLLKDLDEIENSHLEVLLGDGTVRSLHESIEDVIYGMYLHADKNKIETLIKTDMSIYIFTIEKYVTAWEKLLKETYDLIVCLVENKYFRQPYERASVVFDGNDNTQEKNIKSVPYWSNLRGDDLNINHAQSMIDQLPLEELQILNLAGKFFLELEKTPYSIATLNSMIDPLFKEAWGNFEKIHDELANIEWGFSNKVRFNETHDIAHVLLFKNFKSDGLIVISQPQFSNEILALYLRKEKEKADWKIASININPEDLIQTIEINPLEIIKKFGNKLFKKKYGPK